MTGNAFLGYQENNLFTRPVTVTTDDGAPALAVNGFFTSSVSKAVTAAGSTQTDGTLLTSNINILTTNSATTKGVVLPVAVPGMQIYLFNTTANAVHVYGNATDSATIDSAATGTGVVLTNALRAVYVAYDTGKWISYQLGVVSA